jgi:hypothetical protein
MLSFLTRTDELDWRLDPGYLAAVAAVETTGVDAERTEAERVRLWGETNVQGVNPPVNSPYWPVEAAAVRAKQVHADASLVRDRAAAMAKSAVRRVVLDDFHERASRIFAIEDELIEALIALHEVCHGAETQGVTGLPWIAPGQMSIKDLRHNQAARRTLVEQFR